MKLSSVIHLFWITLITAPWPINAADISAIEFGGNYRIKIVGVIEPGDHNRLVTMIKEADDFPDALQFDSAHGDVAESIEIGRFARQAMLATTAGKNCDGGCFLAWVGGVYRKVHGPMDINVPGTDSALAGHVRAYLADMEVSDDVIDKALGTSSEPMTPEQIITIIGANSIGHQRWLAEQCGTLTPQQETDWLAIQALKSMEDSLDNMGMAMGGNSMYAVGAETQEQAARARTFSPDYRDTVIRSRAKIATCRNNAITGARTL